MKVLLIWPYGAFDGATMPLCYIYLVPILRKKFEVQFLDCALHDIHPDSERFVAAIREFKPDVVGVSAWTIHKEMATQTLRKVKELDPNIITIAGGPHFTGSADYSLKSDAGVIDFVLKGEAEFTLQDFLNIVSKDPYSPEDLKKIPGLCFVEENGQVHETRMTFPPSLDEFGQPDYSVIDLPGYLRKGYCYRTHLRMQAPILTTRGCPYTCDFCSAPYLNGRKIRKHSLMHLKELIEHLYDDYGIRHFNIIDDNFTFDTDYAKAFCKMIIDNRKRFRGISFGTPNGIRVERTDQQLFYLMKAAGWDHLIIAPESGSQKMLDRMSKHLNLNIVPDKVEQIQRAGIEVEAFFIIGHPGEDDATIAETRRFIEGVKFDMISLHIFQPLQGTPIYDQLLMLGSISKGDNITSYAKVNWVAENWTREKLNSVLLDLKSASVGIFPCRFEWIFSKFTRTGRAIGRIIGDKRRHALYMSVYLLRRRLWNWIFQLQHGAELQRHIDEMLLQEATEEETRRRENRLKEYERVILEKSDELKRGFAEELENALGARRKNDTAALDLLLNSCEKIETYKNIADE